MERVFHTIYEYHWGLVVWPTLHIVVTVSYRLDAPLQEDMFLCCHSRSKFISHHNLRTPMAPWAEKTIDRLSLSVRSACCSSSFGYWQSFW